MINKGTNNIKLKNILTTLLIIGIFFLDINVPLGIAVGVLYVFPIYIIYCSQKSRYLLISSLVCSGLIILGYFLSPYPVTIIDGYIIANRILSILILAVGAMVLNRNIKLHYNKKLSEKRFQKLYENSISPMITTSLDNGLVVNINNEALKLFGFSEKKEVINKIRSTDYYAKDTNREEMLSKLMEKGYINDYLFTMYDVKGNTMWIEASVKLFKKERVIEGVFHNVTQRIESEKKLHKALHEKEVLLNEVHHRVKNNLQIVWGVLDLQQHKTKNKEVIANIQDSKTRIKTISLLHENLYKAADFTNINFSKYIDNLLIHLQSIYYRNDKKIMFLNKVKGVNFDLELSIPLALAISEILSNSFKHAFINRNNGKIEVKGGKVSDKQYELIINDDGCGFDINKEYNSVGFRLIKNLIDQIESEITIISTQKGTEYKIVINA